MAKVFLPQPGRQITPDTSEQIGRLSDVARVQGEAIRGFVSDVAGAAQDIANIQRLRREQKEETTFNKTKADFNATTSSINEFMLQNPDSSSWQGFKDSQFKALQEKLDADSEEWTPAFRSRVGQYLAEETVKFDARFNPRLITQETKEYNLSVDNLVSNAVDQGDFESAKSLIDTKRIPGEQKEAEKIKARKTGVYTSNALAIRSAMDPEQIDKAVENMEKDFDNGRISKDNMDHLKIEANSKKANMVNGYSRSFLSRKKEMFNGVSYSEGEIERMVNQNEISQEQGEVLKTIQDDVAKTVNAKERYETDLSSPDFTRLDNEIKTMFLFPSRGFDEKGEVSLEEFTSNQISSKIEEVMRNPSIGGLAKMDLVTLLTASRANSLSDGTELIKEANFFGFGAEEREVPANEVAFTSAFYSRLNSDIAKATFDAPKTAIIRDVPDNVAILYNISESIIRNAFKDAKPVDTDELMKQALRPWKQAMVKEAVTKQATQAQQPVEFTDADEQRLQELERRAAEGRL